ncbi:MAG: hypothetical protein PUK18_08170, partial [Firmicutes bacterium]|nr:hypothetical protein [Bacillota bacterium]MDY6161606.1 hypothetical protein [Candidatus Faecousia sp.]
CLVYCFVVIQLYHKMERISSFFALFFVVWLVLDLWITLEVQYTETQVPGALTYGGKSCIICFDDPKSEKLFHEDGPEKEKHI